MKRGGSDRDAAKRIVMMRRASFIAAAIASSGMATACACLKVKPDAEPSDAGASATPTAVPTLEESAMPPGPCLKAPIAADRDAGTPRPDASTPRPCLKPPNRTPGQ